MSIKNYFYQKVFARFKPTLILVIGKRGKSMTSQAILTLLKDRELKAIYLDLEKSDIQAAVACLKSKFSLWAACKQAFWAKNYPAYLICELHAEPQFLPAENVIVIKTTGEVGYKFPKQVKIISLETSLLQADYLDFIVDQEESYSIDKRVQGVFCKIQDSGSSLPLQIYGGIGQPHFQASILTLNIAKLLGINLLEAINSLRKIPLLPGRMKLVPGIKKSLLIDDSYDTDPDSLLMAVNEASTVPIHTGKRRILVLGDMLDLGAKTEKSHVMIGQEISTLGFDLVVGIGEKMYDLLQGAKNSGMAENKLFHFTNKEEAGKFVQHEMHADELILIKGSKQDKLESVVKELMAFPLKAKEELLQR